MNSITHISAPCVTVDGRTVQLCAYCGSVLIDSKGMAGVVQPDGSPPPVCTWEPFRLVRYTFGNPRVEEVLPDLPGSKLPEDSCTRFAEYEPGRIRRIYPQASNPKDFRHVAYNSGDKEGDSMIDFITYGGLIGQIQTPNPDAPDDPGLWQIQHTALVLWSANAGEQIGQRIRELARQSQPKPAGWICYRCKTRNPQAEPKCLDCGLTKTGSRQAWDEDTEGG